MTSCGVGLALDLEDDADVVGRLVAHVDERTRAFARDDDVRDLRDDRALLPARTGST